MNHLPRFVQPSRAFSLTATHLRRRPPVEEYENNPFHTRKKTADPYDRRWRWTAKSAEPYCKKGGDIEWTKMPFLHSGVQRPGYTDPVDKQFHFVPEMVPELVVPDLSDFELKPYVSYNVTEAHRPVFQARDLYDRTLKNADKDEFLRRQETKPPTNN